MWHCWNIRQKAMFDNLIYDILRTTYVWVACRHWILQTGLIANIINCTKAYKIKDHMDNWTFLTSNTMFDDLFILYCIYI